LEADKTMLFYADSVAMVVATYCMQKKLSVSLIGQFGAGVCAAMSREPSQTQQQAMDHYCALYRLFDDDWYVGLKTELARRGTLAIAQVF
jgi:hypothetical protein